MNEENELNVGAEEVVVAAEPVEETTVEAVEEVVEENTTGEVL